MNKFRIVAFAGSLRKASFHRMLIERSEEIMKDVLDVEHCLLNNIPVYNMDDEENPPAVITELKSKIRNANGVLIAVPEHNFSYSGALKNAIDWLSRPMTENPFDKKPVAIFSVSTGMLGGSRAQYHFRQVLSYMKANQMYFPEMFVPFVKTKIDESGNITDDKTKEVFEKFLKSFYEFIANSKASE